MAFECDRHEQSAVATKAKSETTARAKNKPKAKAKGAAKAAAKQAGKAKADTLAMRNLLCVINEMLSVKAWG